MTNTWGGTLNKEQDNFNHNQWSGIKWFPSNESYPVPEFAWNSKCWEFKIISTNK